LTMSEQTDVDPPDTDLPERPDLEVFRMDRNDEVGERLVFLAPSDPACEQRMSIIEDDAVEVRR